LTVFACAAGSERVPEGMLYTDQWRKIPAGASGSSTNIAIERVPPGTSDHRRGIDVFLPSHVYSTGIEAPSSKAAEEILSVAIRELSGSNSVSLSSLEPHAVRKIAVASAIEMTEKNRS